MFYRFRLGMVLVSACLTIHSFSSGVSYFYIYFYIVCCCFLLLKNKFDLIWFEESRHRTKNTLLNRWWHSCILHLRGKKTILFKQWTPCIQQQHCLLHKADQMSVIRLIEMYVCSFLFYKFSATRTEFNVIVALTFFTWIIEANFAS